MVFRRRKKRTTLKNLRELFLPENGWRRAIEYISYRIQRLPDTPHRIALGLACGVLACFTPLFGFHFLVGGGLAFIARANVLASILGTFFGNPITFPFIAAISVRFGNLILDWGANIDGDRIRESGDWVYEIDLSSLEVLKKFLLEVYSENFFPYLFGGLFLGLPVALLVYLFSTPIIITYQKRKRRRKS